MRILVHDYCGHPFQVELSRAFAARGHDVLHVFSASFLTPQGALARTDSDPKTFDVKPIVLAEKINKENLVKRRSQEIQHGLGVVEAITSFKPNVVISANSPLEAQKRMQSACSRQGIPMVYWTQDLLGLATMTLLKDKIPVIGYLAGSYYLSLEKSLLKSSKAIVAISSDFKDIMRGWGIDEGKVQIIENWAPLADMPMRPVSNPWSIAQGLDGKFLFVYSGTLGMKHNPSLLLELAKAFADDPDVRVVVISEGPGRKWLEEKKAEQSINNLVLLDFQPFDQLPDVLGSAEVVVAILEKEAGALAVPSKVMTYMCTGRPMLLAVPGANLSARAVKSNGTGLTSEPDDLSEFLANAKRLRQDESLRKQQGANARKYAEEKFDIRKITDAFEGVLKSVSK